MTELTGRIISPGDPGWETARHGFAAWADYAQNMPRYVVFCQNTQDVSNAVRWARENNAPFRVRCGRHNYEAYSSLVKDGIIIDVSDMDAVSVSMDKQTARIGAGIDMEEMFEKLGACGVTIPAATGPTVGLAGLTLGGGFGVTSRLWGLTCDSVLEFEVVNASGEVIYANREINPNLYWACKGGGGGNFGIVTSFLFQAHPINNVAVYSITWPWEAFEPLVATWQQWAHDVDEGLSSALALVVTGSINMYGQYTASDEDLPKIQQLLAPMLAAAPATAVSIQLAPAVIGTRVILGLDPTNPTELIDTHSDMQIFKSSSALAYEYFSPDTISLLKRLLESYPPLDCSPSQPSMVQLLGGGGYVERIGPTETAVFWRQAKFVVQYDAYWTSPNDGERTVNWIEGVRRTMQPYTIGAYVNYQDDSIQDWLAAYYGGNLERLVEVKREYDPENVFNFPQSIPLSL
jgi:FAD/FMN-containing dehydrogenase